MATPTDPLRCHLDYEPQPLKFGTSGRRGLVIHLTQLEIYTNVQAEIQYLQSLSPDEGGIVAGDEFYIAHDLRPSSTRYVDGARGGLFQAVEQAVKDGGMRPINLGAIPTPALTYFALQRRKGSIMVTGSHIPFDRNGYKLNTSLGELLKKDEQPINAAVERTRQVLLDQPYADSLFNAQGMLRHAPSELPPVLPAGRADYIQRYLDFFAGETLKGMKILVYQHSAVGRDLVVEVLEQLGATVVPVGRSESFVPIDTEAIDEAQLNTIQALYDSGTAGETFDAIVSTDGDSDRPLVLAPGPDGKRLRFFGGDLLGMVVADFLHADAVVVPISSNDAIDRSPLGPVTEPKTKIGSPYVIAGLQRAALHSPQRTRICGWEANGGFLTGSDISRNGHVLSALPTRDAVLPILCVLFASQTRQLALSEIFATLPHRFSRAALLRNFPRPTSLKIVERFSPPSPAMQEISFPEDKGTILASDSSNSPLSVTAAHADTLATIRETLQTVFTAASGFPAIIRINYVDGVRLIFANGDVAHFRPSGNADELRIYAVADSQDRADEIARMGVMEPNGLLRRLEQMV